MPAKARSTRKGARKEGVDSEVVMGSQEAKGKEYLNPDRTPMTEAEGAAFVMMLNPTRSLQLVARRNEVKCPG
jgi:hypothetical protein